jgi:hypothetical protein
MRRVADAMRAAAATRPPHAPFAFGFDGALAVSTLPTREAYNLYCTCSE